eukprot:4478405-Heterocapsa_arctica.AAC.1
MVFDVLDEHSLNTMSNQAKEPKVRVEEAVTVKLGAILIGRIYAVNRREAPPRWQGMAMVQESVVSAVLEASGTMGIFARKAIRQGGKDQKSEDAVVWTRDFDFKEVHALRKRIT